MPVYFYWGDDSYRLEQATQHLRETILDPAWTAFNFDRLPPESTMTGLNQAMTPPLGLGDRLVWLEETKVTQQCPDELWIELNRTLQHLPETTHLLLTSSYKPDGRLKSTKLLKQVAKVTEFNRLPPWDSDKILRQVKEQAAQMRLKLTPEAAKAVAEAVGNDSRKLVMELEKLMVMISDQAQPLSLETIHQLVPASAYNSFQLAGSLKQGNLDRSLDILTHLLDQNEPGLKILAVLVGQFRTWLWVKLLLDQGERNAKVIAQAAEISNPNRVYFLQKEVQALTATSLQGVMQILLDLEYSLKLGRPEREAFHIALVQITLCTQPNDLP